MKVSNGACVEACARMRLVGKCAGPRGDLPGAAFLTAGRGFASQPAFITGHTIPSSVRLCCHSE